MLTQKLLKAVIGASTVLVLATACSSTTDTGTINPDTDISQQEPGADAPEAPGDEAPGDEAPGDDTGEAPDDQTSDGDDSGDTGESDDAGDDGAESDNDGCWVELFDGDNFDENDDHFTLTQPGDYEDLSDLPGADQDWTDEADSVRVGDSATVTVFTEKGLTGDQQELEPGSEHADIDDVYSLTMTC